MLENKVSRIDKDLFRLQSCFNNFLQKKPWDDTRYCFWLTALFSPTVTLVFHVSPYCSVASDAYSDHAVTMHVVLFFIPLILSHISSFISHLINAQNIILKYFLSVSDRPRICLEYYFFLNYFSVVISELCSKDRLVFLTWSQQNDVAAAVYLISNDRFLYLCYCLSFSNWGYCQWTLIKSHQHSPWRSTLTEF